MNGKYSIADVYRDFFETPYIESNSINEAQSSNAFNMGDIDTLLITEEAKDLLKKVIEYMYKVKEEKTLPYIDFHLLLESDNKETIDKFENIVENANKYYRYVGFKKAILSFYEVDTLDKVKDIFNNDLIVIRDIKGINLRDENFKKVF